MRIFLQKRREIILVLIPIILAILTLYAGELERRISEIYTSYLIDVVTLNNSFITLAINVAGQDMDSIQKVKSSLNDQMGAFNNKYGDVESELKWKEFLASKANSIIFIILLLQMIIVVLVPPKSQSDWTPW